MYGFVRDVEFVRDFGGENGVVEFELDGVGLLFATLWTGSRFRSETGAARRFRKRSWLSCSLSIPSVVFGQGDVKAGVLGFSTLSCPLSSSSSPPNPCPFNFPDRFHRTIIDIKTRAPPSPHIFPLSEPHRLPRRRQNSHYVNPPRRSTSLDLLHGIRIAISMSRIWIAFLISNVKNPVASLRPEHGREQRRLWRRRRFFVVVVSSTDE